MTWADGRSLLTPWTVKEGKLVLGNSPDGFTGQLLATASQHLSTKMMRIRLGSETQYEIADFGKDAVVLIRHLEVRRSLAPVRLDIRSTLTRVPE